jgi:hypothetical protein
MAAAAIFNIPLTTSVPFSATTSGMEEIEMSTRDGQVFKITTALSELCKAGGAFH